MRDCWLHRTHLQGVLRIKTRLSIAIIAIWCIAPLQGYAQNVEEASHEPILLADALGQLTDRFNTGFIYRSEVVENKKVDVREGVTLREILEAILEQHNLIAIRVGKESFVVLPYEERSSIEGVEIIGGRRAVRTAVLEGTVRSPSGEPLPGAQVFVPGIRSGSITTRDGAYAITDIPPGTHKVLISYLGFQAKEEVISLKEGQSEQLDATLRYDVLQLDGIVTTATNSARLLRESGVSMSVITAQEIERIAPGSQADILRTVPGVHAEGGGGEVHANVFIRGLPAPGQYKYSTVQEDGMPLISDVGIMNAVIDAFYRYDLGVEKLEFVRGGSSSLYGVASPVGVANYISKTGGSRPESVVQVHVGERDLYRFDFNTGGPIGERWRYNISGFYKYDEGPVVTGLPSEGMQLRGNFTKILDDGYVRLHAKYLDDRAQFFLPFPHNTETRQPARGVDGRAISTLNASQGANFAFQSPSGVFESRMEDGISTTGPSAMIELVKEFENGVRLENKTRWSTFDYQGRLFLPFPAFQNRDLYAGSHLGTDGLQRARYVYTDTGEPYDGAYVVDQGALHWSRQVQDLVNKTIVTKAFDLGTAYHEINAGVFMSRTSVDQVDVEPWLLTEFADTPRLLDLIIDDAGPDGLLNTEDDTETLVTLNGIASASRSYSNVQATSNRIVFFAGNEVNIQKRLRLDVGLRYEIRQMQYTTEEAGMVGEDGTYGDALAVQGFIWGTGRFREQKGRSQDLAASIGLNYALVPTLNAYGVVSRSHFFPELTVLTTDTDLVDLDNERFLQFETGLKYSKGSLAFTLAVYLAVLEDRYAVDIRADEQGVVRNRAIKVGGSRTVGLEWTWGYIPEQFNTLHVFGDMTIQAHEYVDFRLDGIDVSGNWIERQPRFMLRGGASFSMAPVSITATAKYTGDRFAGADNLHRLDGYTLVDFDATYTFDVSERQMLRLGIHVFNLLNSRGLTEGDPRLLPGTSIEDQPFFNARPVLPRRSSLRLTYIF